MDILFWSGGKDAYLALVFYLQQHIDREGLKLLTTYSEETEQVPHQNLPLKTIREQSEHLRLKLIPVPLPSSCPNEQYLQKVGEALEAQEDPIGRLVFGDWRNEEIRNWRVREFGKMGYDCLFPIWRKSLHDLLPVLILKPVRIRISAVSEKYRKYIRIGETYDQAFVRTLPNEIDPMGENGEFHTEVIFLKPGERVV